MRLNLFRLLILILASGCASTANRKLASVDLPWGLSSSLVPDPQALKNWRDAGFASTNQSELDQWRAENLPSNCSDQNLYPTHPQQSSKQYHIHQIASYAHFDLPAESVMCAITTRPSSASARKYCLKAYQLNYVVLSDIFQNSCGEKFRGFWQVVFSSKNEKMQLLFSKGRSLVKNPESEFEGDFVVDGTSAVPKEDFFFLAPLFPGDLERAKDLREGARQNFTYDPSTLLFKPKKQIFPR